MRLVFFFFFGFSGVVGSSCSYLKIHRTCSMASMTSQVYGSDPYTCFEVLT